MTPTRGSQPGKDFGAADLLQSPTDEISPDDRMTMFRGDGSEPGTSLSARSREHVQMGRPVAATPAKELDDLHTPPDAGLPGKALVRLRLRPGSRRLHVRLLPSDLHDELVTTLPAPTIQDLAAALGGHARAESVLVQALPVPWIVCRLHGPLTSAKFVGAEAPVRAELEKIPVRPPRGQESALSP